MATGLLVAINKNTPAVLRIRMAEVPAAVSILIRPVIT
jgi:hypothetical protein